MGKRNDKTVHCRPSADELQKIDTLVRVLKDRGAKPATMGEYTRSRAMIDAAIQMLERENLQK